MHLFLTLESYAHIHNPKHLKEYLVHGIQTASCDSNQIPPSFAENAAPKQEVTRVSWFGAPLERSLPCPPRCKYFPWLIVKSSPLGQREVLLL